MKKILIFLTCLLTLTAAYSQFSGNQKAFAEIKALTERYKSTGQISFHVLYHYANEQNPGNWLDTLQGSFKLNGNRYWYSLDSTEAMGTSDYTIMLFKEDRIMYLSRPSPVLQKLNPLATLDSFLLKSESVQADVIDQNGEKQVILQFNPGSAYKKIVYYINSKTGLLTRVVNTVESEQLYESSLRFMLGGTKTYVFIEIQFSQYKEGTPDEKIFDAGRYFKKQGDVFATVPPYEGYKIFLGSPELGKTGGQ